MRSYNYFEFFLKRALSFQIKWYQINTDFLSSFFFLPNQFTKFDCNTYLLLVPSSNPKPDLDLKSQKLINNHQKIIGNFL